MVPHVDSQPILELVLRANITHINLPSRILLQRSRHLRRRHLAHNHDGRDLHPRAPSARFVRERVPARPILASNLCLRSVDFRRERVHETQILIQTLVLQYMRSSNAVRTADKRARDLSVAAHALGPKTTYRYTSACVPNVPT